MDTKDHKDIMIILSVLGVVLWKHRTHTLLSMRLTFTFIFIATVYLERFWNCWPVILTFDPEWLSVLKEVGSCSVFCYNRLVGLEDYCKAFKNNQPSLCMYVVKDITSLQYLYRLQMLV